MTSTSTVQAVPPPTVPGVPVLGVLPKVWRDPLKFFLDAASQHGPVVRLRMGPKDFYLVSGPEQVKQVLQDNNRNYRKGYDQAKPLFGEGLLTAEGESWLRQRRLIQPMFNRERLAFFARFMTDATDEMLKNWERLADSGEVVDISQEMMRLTQTIIVRTMFSQDVGGQADAIGAAFDDTLAYLNRILFSPSPLLTQLPSAANRRNQQALRFLDDYIYGLIRDRRKSGEDNGDLLSLLVFSKDETDGQGMDDGQIRDELMTIFLAGHETTANALSWTWYLLAKHPDVEARLLSEVDSAFAGQPPSMDGLKQLQEVPLALHESLRLYPPAWMFVRHAIETDDLCGVRLPAGEMVMISPYVTHRLPAVWDDPSAFDPYRFLPERSQERHRFAYFPFGGGPRLCIGNNFALIEAQLVMANLLQRYRLELAPGTVVTPKPIATLQPKPGLPMRIRRR